MVEQVTAYRSSTGMMFPTKKEAETDEIRNAADALAGVEKNHLVNVATGYSSCKTTRDALVLLAEAVKRNPIPDQEAPRC